MPIDYSVLAITKGRPRVVDRIQRKRDLDATIRACRKAVRARDKGRCVVPGCRERAQHLHHIRFRSQGGKWTTGNVCSLCVSHHQMVHTALIEITGDADDELIILGSKDRLRFGL
jgi:5-methylcytosine-specific restriction endonuclease McrA